MRQLIRNISRLRKLGKEPIETTMLPGGGTIKTPKSLDDFKEYNRVRNAVPEWLVQVLYKLRVI